MIYVKKCNATHANHVTKLFHRQDIQSEIITFELIPSDTQIAKKLQIEEGSFVYHIICFLRIEDTPYILEFIYMPVSIIPNIKEEHIQSSIYQYIENELHLKIQSAHKTIRGRLSGHLEQQYLGLSKREPYFEVEQIGYLNSGVIFEYSSARFRYDDFELQTVILKPQNENYG